MTIRSLRRAGGLAALALGSYVLAAPTLALEVTSGGQEIRIDARSEVNPTSTRFVGYLTLPGSYFGPLTVPAGATRHFNARFAAESRCFGASTAPSAWCSVRIEAHNFAGTSFFLNPNSGLDFAFDTNPPGEIDDMWEGNAMERSIELPAGTYYFRVQIGVTDSETTFTVDDWHFTLEVNS